MLRKWDELPRFMQCEEVREYYDILSTKSIQLKVKRIADVILSVSLLIIFLLPMLIIAYLIKKDSVGPVFYRQERITSYGRRFKIHKFRTMVTNADKIGSEVTIEGDSRITRIGATLRKYRLDELPQLIDVLFGDMTFVGTRPEVDTYVRKYNKEMLATLLLPAGITSEASIKYKDEAKLLKDAAKSDSVYIDTILPAKMEYNLKGIRKFGILYDIKIMIYTLKAVFAKEK